MSTDAESADALRLAFHAALDPTAEPLAWDELSPRGRIGWLAVLEEARRPAALGPPVFRMHGRTG